MRDVTVKCLRINTKINCYCISDNKAYNSDEKRDAIDGNYFGRKKGELCSYK